MSDENLHIHIIEYPDANTWVAECLEVPIIVEAETSDKVVEKISLAMKGFLETFPDKKYTTPRELPLEKPVLESGKSILMISSYH